MTPQNLQPLNGRILIEVLTEKQKYEGLLDVSSMASKEKSNIALVKTLPLGYTDSGLLKEGDKIIFNLNSGAIIVLDKYNKEAPEYRLIKEEDILCRVLDAD